MALIFTIVTDLLLYRNKVLFSLQISSIVIIRDKQICGCCQILFSLVLVLVCLCLNNRCEYRDFKNKSNQIKNYIYDINDSFHSRVWPRFKWHTFLNKSANFKIKRKINSLILPEFYLSKLLFTFVFFSLTRMDEWHEMAIGLPSIIFIRFWVMVFHAFINEASTLQITATFTYFIPTNDPFILFSILFYDWR